MLSSLPPIIPIILPRTNGYRKRRIVASGECAKEGSNVERRSITERTTNRSHWNNETRMNRGNIAWKAANLVVTPPRRPEPAGWRRSAGWWGRGERGWKLQKGFPAPRFFVTVGPQGHKGILPAPAGTRREPGGFHSRSDYRDAEEKTTYTRTPRRINIYEYQIYQI